MPKAFARRATSTPTRPRPTMPKVLPRSSVPCSDFFSHFPARVVWSARGINRASESISPSVCSATAIAFAPGVFITTIPLGVAASESTLSTPTPARPITRNRCVASMSFAFTSVAERTTSASASRTALARSPICSGVTTSNSGSSRNIFRAAGETFSAIRIFIDSKDENIVVRPPSAGC